MPKNRKSRFSNGFRHFPTFTLNYHPALKTLFLCDRPPSGDRAIAL
ncbi:hypothetical protein COO91_08058 [Nostoc flagelliforme CCNUN1]|uniref:Uncharacterized protein n=1 Tax=Nostoc flagelliforme CCNUN1 TaxID=2038116 RepID=A0A2K8T4N4_9NOSO|nr:hypothetical protein COO91_08058 [Nostoc flagelliforme CCNUN1]